MASQGVSRLRAIVILMGTVEAAILVVIFVSFVYAAAMAADIRALLYVVVVYMALCGPSLICALAGLRLGIKNRWLQVALALLIVALLLPFATIPLVGPVGI